MLDKTQFIDTYFTLAEGAFLTGQSIRWFVSRRLVQWGFLQLAGITLLIAPIQGRWSDELTLYSRLAVIGCCLAAQARGEKLLERVELETAKNRTLHRDRMEQITHALDCQRAVRQRQLRELSGLQPTWYDTLPPIPGEDLATSPAALPPAATQQHENVKFDIHRLNPPKADRGKNILIVAGQDVGKTTLGLYIAGEILQSEDIQVYDLDDDGNTWGNLPVWGTGDDDSEIAGAMQLDAELFEQRTADRLKGERVSFSVRILDETPTVVQRIAKPYATWSFMMTSRARKRGLIAILLTQFRDPEMNGLKPDQQKTAFTTIYLGWKQVNHALNYLVKPKPDADRLRAALDGCDRPALIYFEDGWYWWNVPDLKEWKDNFLAQTQKQVNPSSDTQLGIKAPKPTFSMANLEPLQKEFIAYLSDKKPDESEWFNVRVLYRNWGSSRFSSTDDFKSFLASLITVAAIRSRDSDLGWITLSDECRSSVGSIDL